MKKRIILAITGASGVIYGIRALRHLAAMKGVETHLILSEGALVNIAVETGEEVEAIKGLADVVHRNDNLAAAIASGSCPMDGMLVMPCSIKTLSGIANCYADTLILRAADVTLKESRKLVLAVRESPLHLGHLRLQVRAAEAGAVIMPPVPAFYHRPQSIEDLVDHFIGRAFDQLGLESSLFKRWGGAGPPPRD